MNDEYWICRATWLFRGAIGGNGALIAAILLFTSLGCDSTKKPKQTKNPKVVVTKPIADWVMDYHDFTGRLEAVKTVEIRARVSGAITGVLFKEGDLVTEGMPLFQIDDRTYRAELVQALAKLNLAIADRNVEKTKFDRAHMLYTSNVLSKEVYEEAMAAHEKAIAAVKAAEAAREWAKMYVDFTLVTSPVSGRISQRFKDPGNIITADNTVLTTIVTEDPIYAYFDVDERTYLELQSSTPSGTASPTSKQAADRAKMMQRLKLPFLLWTANRSPLDQLAAIGASQYSRPVPVLMRLANEPDFEKVGSVNFIDNRVIANTGTVRMRGVFDNLDGRLKPGLFVRVRMPTGSAYEAVLIPDEAIQSDQERKFVWVVNAKNEAEYRSVRLGQAIKDLRVIRPPQKGMEAKEGLALGDRIIVSGMQRVRNGLPVDPQDQAPPAAPQMPLVRILKKNLE